MSDVIVTAIVTVCAVVSGAIVSLFGVLAVSSRNARTEERKHYRELGLKIGLTNFEHCMKLAQSAANTYQERFEVPPVKVFVIQRMKLMEIISDSSLSADEMARRIAESEDVTQRIQTAAKQKQAGDIASKSDGLDEA